MNGIHSKCVYHWQLIGRFCCCYYFFVISFLFSVKQNHNCTSHHVDQKVSQERKIVVCHRKHKSLTPSFFSFALYLLQCMEAKYHLRKKDQLHDGWQRNLASQPLLSYTSLVQNVKHQYFNMYGNAMHVNKSSGEFIASLCQCDVACAPNGLARIFNI